MIKSKLFESFLFLLCSLSSPSSCFCFPPHQHLLQKGTHNLRVSKSVRRYSSSLSLELPPLAAGIPLLPFPLPSSAPTPQLHPRVSTCSYSSLSTGNLTQAQESTPPLYQLLQDSKLVITVHLLPNINHHDRQFYFQISFFSVFLPVI